METGFFTGNDGTKRYYRGWTLSGKASGTVVIAHGYAEHGDRFAELAAVLNDTGFNVWAHDHYGHGQSEGKRADVPRFELFAEDTDIFISRIVEPDSPSPLFLYGHSMGGAVSLLYAIQHQPRLRGLLLSGPVVRPGAQSSGFERILARVLSKILPGLPYLPFDAHLLTHDSHVVEAYIQDPLVYSGKMKIRLGYQFLRAEELLSDAALKSLSLPVLIMHGGDDQTVIPYNSEVLNRLVSSEDKTRHVFEGMYHEIHNEPGKKEVFNLVTSWLKAHI